MVSDDESCFSDILDHFVEIMKGNHCENSDSWIRRRENAGLLLGQEYPSVVERICSKYTAVVTIAMDELSVGNDLVRALMFVNRLRPSQHAPAYEVLQEGDIVFTEVERCNRDQGNIFQYFVKSCYKNGGKMDEKSLLRIKDPLRGVVEKLVNEEVGIIRFQTYEGRVTKAIFSRESLYQKGLQIKKECPIATVAQKNTHVYLEVSKWDTNEIKENWEKDVREDNVVLKANIVWLKDDERPSRKTDESEEASRERAFLNCAGGKNEKRNNSDSHQEYENKCSISGNVNQRESLCPDCSNNEEEYINQVPGNGIKATLISVDVDWGMVAVGKDVYVFESNDSYLYGLKIESLPFYKVFNCGQVVCIKLEEGKVKSLQYGTFLHPSLRKTAIYAYCKRNSISDEIRMSLENMLMKQPT